MRKRLYVALVLAASCAVFFMVCGQSSSTYQTPEGYSHLDLRGDCLGDNIAVQDSAYLETEVIGNDLHLRHRQAFYNCCLGYKVNYTVWESTITAVESDTAGRCRCDCYFNLESVLYHLPAGSYVVTLIGISGNIVGIDTIIVF